jgi:hypothetical protein
MYCPKCSQQQVSDEVRFCSRCGFSLSAVRELINSGSVLMGRGTEAQAGQLPQSQRGVRKGACLMLASLALTLVVGLLSAIDDVFAVLVLLPVLCFVVGFGRVLYGVFLEKSTLTVKGVASQAHGVPVMAGQINSAVRSPELSSPRAMPIGSFTVLRAETAEMVQPPSVAEGTTRLLDEEADSHRR